MKPKTCDTCRSLRLIDDQTFCGRHPPGVLLLSDGRVASSYPPVRSGFPACEEYGKTLRTVNA